MNRCWLFLVLLVVPGCPRDGSSQDTQSPGLRVSDPATAGRGPCTGTTLGALAVQIRGARPELAAAGLEGNLGTDPRSTGWIEAYQRPDGGFALTFSLVGPDCGERCRNHRKVYFETEAGCRPVLLGEFSFGWSHDEVRCWYAEGIPRWGSALDPARRCPIP